MIPSKGESRRDWRAVSHAASTATNGPTLQPSMNVSVPGCVGGKLACEQGLHRMRQHIGQQKPAGNAEQQAANAEPESLDHHQPLHLRRRSADRASPRIASGAR